MKQITLNEFRDNLRESKSLLLKNLRVKMKVIAGDMERKVKDEPAFRGWKNDSGRLAGSTSAEYAIVDGKPSILLQSGGQFRGFDVFYARILEFGTPQREISVRRHNVKKHRVSAHSVTRKTGTTYSKKAHSRGPMTRGPYQFTKPKMRGRFYLRRTVEWGTQQFPKDLREVLTFALAGKNINA